MGLRAKATAIEVASSDLAELYETVLIDSPISSFFKDYLDRNTKELKNYQEVQTFFKEEKPEKVRQSLQRIYLEKFY